MGNPAFNGTSLAGEHIGDDAADELSLVRAEITAGAEAANAIPFSLQVVDLKGNAVKEVVRLLCKARGADLVVDASVFTLAETGAGTEISTTGAGELYIETDENGQAEVTLTDVAGTSTEKVYLECEPVNRAGAVSTGTATFA